MCGKRFISEEIPLSAAGDQRLFGPETNECIGRCLCLTNARLRIAIRTCGLDRLPKEDRLNKDNLRSRKPSRSLKLLLEVQGNGRAADAMRKNQTKIDSKAQKTS
jgi:hypothetical protein